MDQIVYRQSVMTQIKNLRPIMRILHTEIMHILFVIQKYLNVHVLECVSHLFMHRQSHTCGVCRYFNCNPEKPAADWLSDNDFSHFLRYKSNILFFFFLLVLVSSLSALPAFLNHLWSFIKSVERNEESEDSASGPLKSWSASFTSFQHA